MGGGPAHSLLDEHEHYSAGVGFAMMFNLIVGAGALALPKACVRACVHAFAAWLVCAT